MPWAALHLQLGFAKGQRNYKSFNHYEGYGIPIQLESNY